MPHIEEAEEDLADVPGLRIEHWELNIGQIRFPSHLLQQNAFHY
jgi:hypothetical protein